MRHCIHCGQPQPESDLSSPSWFEPLIERLQGRIADLENIVRLNAPLNVFVGYDPAEYVAWRVAVDSITRSCSTPLHIRSCWAPCEGYERPTERRNGLLWDEISQAPMSTAHALARFFIPRQMQYQGWAVFMDGDVLVRRSLESLFALADPRFAVMVVKHAYHPTATLKKDGAIQTAYPRKNWSSVMLWNCAHPANQRLTLEMLNGETGRHLHGFCWLDDSEIGELPVEWNWLVGHSSPSVNPAIVHFTEGLPSLPGFDSVPFAEEWRAIRDRLLITA